MNVDCVCCNGVISISSNALKLFCLPQDTHKYTHTHTDTQIHWCGGVQMRMTCKYVCIYLNVFYKNTRTDSRSHARREREGERHAGLVGSRQCFVFSHCGIKPTNNLSQHEFFLPEKLWQKKWNTYTQTRKHTHTCIPVYRHTGAQTHLNCTFAVALLSYVAVVGLINRFSGLASARLGLVWSGLAWLGKGKRKKDIQFVRHRAVCCSLVSTCALLLDSCRQQLLAQVATTTATTTSHDDNKSQTVKCIC